MKYNVPDMRCSQCNVAMEPWWQDVEVKDLYHIEVQGRICTQCGSVFVMPQHPFGEEYAQAMVRFVQNFINLRFPCTSTGPHNVDVQIAVVEQIGNLLEEVSRVPNSIGVRPFHAANDMASTLNFTAGTLREVNALFHLMRTLHSNTGIDLGCYEDADIRAAKEG